jgi:hypothetical protein
MISFSTIYVRLLRVPTPDAADGPGGGESFTEFSLSESFRLNIKIVAHKEPGNTNSKLAVA